MSISVLILALSIRKFIKLEYRRFSELVFPIVIGLVVLVLMQALHGGLKLLINYFLSMIISVCIGAIIYLLWVFISNIFNRKEKAEFFQKRAQKIKSCTKKVSAKQKNP